MFRVKDLENKKEVFCMFAPKGYKLVFEDNFEKEALDTNRWYYRGTGAVGAGFFSPGQVKVKNGQLIISGEYHENGELGAGWYAGMIAIKEKFCRGYFEARMIASRPIPENGLWSAFWIQADHPYDAEISKGGPGGAEIDIVEVFHINGRPAADINIHCSGVTERASAPGQIDSLKVGTFYPPTICSEFNVFGLEWTEDAYIFSINGEEVARSSFGDGVSRVAEEVVLSLCLPEKSDHPRDEELLFVVDYVKVYQKE